MQTSIFDIDIPLECRRESYDRLVPSRLTTDTNKVKDAIRKHNGLTAKQVEEVTGLRTNIVTRILSDNKRDFSISKVYSEKTNRNVSFYQVK